MDMTLEEALRKGVEAHRAGQTQEADRFYTAILQVQPKHPDANHNMGVLGMSVGQPEQALPFFRIAVESNPNIEQYWVSYISNLIGLGQTDEAKSACDQALKKGIKGDAFNKLNHQINTPNQDPPQDQLQSLIDLYNQGEFQKILTQSLQLRGKFPTSVNLLNLSAASHAGLKQYSEAIKNYTHAIKLKPDFADAYNNMGNSLEKQGDLDGAIKSYEQALKIKPNYAEAYLNIGNTLEAKGELDAAIDRFKRAIKIRPNYAEAHNNIGMILARQNDVDGAINSYKQAIRLKPDFTAAYNNLGNIQKESKGDINGAIETYRKAAKIDSNFAETYNNMGTAFQANGDIDSAIKCYRQALELKPDFAHAYNNVGNALQKKGDLGGAINNHQQAIKIKPDYAEAYNDMGAALQKKGVLNEARKSYKKANEIKPNLISPYINMGTVYYLTGGLNDAANSYKQALELKPDYRSAWKNIYFALKAIQSQNTSLVDQLALELGGSLSKSIQAKASLLQYKLDIGSSIAESSFNNTVALLSNVENITIENPNKTTKNVALTALPKKIMALLHFGRSGTGLLHSLIDGHSEISTLPSIYLSEFFDISTWEKLTTGTWDEIPERFIAMYPVLFDATARNPIASMGDRLIYSMGEKEGMTRMGPTQNEVLMLDKGIFRKELLQLMTHYDQLDAITFFQLIHIAYEKVLANTDLKTTLFYHIHNPDICAKLNFVRSAPTANWLMIVREPLQSCESITKSIYKNNLYEEMGNQIVTMLFQIDDVVFRTQRSTGVRLEDLKRYPKESMSALCDWMGIEEEESLYEMTAQGKKWWGDLSSPDLKEDHMKPFGTGSIEREVGSIFSDHDQFILHTLFYPFSVRFGYVEENLGQFKNNLRKIRPMLNQMFDFEKVIAKETQTDQIQFMKSGPYQYLRTCLIERWNILNEFGTYPHMIEPLLITTSIDHN